MTTVTSSINRCCLISESIL